MSLGTTYLENEVKITGSLSNLLFLETINATNQNRGQFFALHSTVIRDFPFEVNAFSNHFVFNENAIFGSFLRSLISFKSIFHKYFLLYPLDKTK